MRYEVKELKIYIEGVHTDRIRKFIFFLTVYEGLTFKFTKQLEQIHLLNALRFPKFISTDKKWPVNCPQEEIRILHFGEYKLAYNSSIIQIDD